MYRLNDGPQSRFQKRGQKGIRRSGIAGLGWLLAPWSVVHLAAPQWADLPDGVHHTHGPHSLACWLPWHPPATHPAGPHGTLLLTTRLVHAGPPPGWSHHHLLCAEDVARVLTTPEPVAHGVRNQPPSRDTLIWSRGQVPVLSFLKLLGLLQGAVEAENQGRGECPLSRVRGPSVLAAQWAPAMAPIEAAPWLTAPRSSQAPLGGALLRAGWCMGSRAKAHLLSPAHLAPDVAPLPARPLFLALPSMCLLHVLFLRAREWLSTEDGGFRLLGSTSLCAPGAPANPSSPAWSTVAPPSLPETSNKNSVFNLTKYEKI